MGGLLQGSSQPHMSKPPAAAHAVQVLPRLADILSSRPKLLRCFEAAAEGPEEGADGGGATGGGA